jgi:hypothetical protein
MDMHRPRLDIGYVAIFEQVASIMEDLPKLSQANILIFDSTDLGAPVVQSARQQGLKCTGIAITAGQTANLVGQNRTVPKALLVGEQGTGGVQSLSLSLAVYAIGLYGKVTLHRSW